MGAFEQCALLMNGNKPLRCVSHNKNHPILGFGLHPLTSGISQVKHQYHSLNGQNAPGISTVQMQKVQTQVKRNESKTIVLHFGT